MKNLIEGHRYELDNFENKNESGQQLQFIQKEPTSAGDGTMRTVNDGTTIEDVTEVLIDRMNYLQKKFPCRENAIAITNFETALLWLNKRTADRLKRNVEGKHLA